MRVIAVEMGGFISKQEVGLLEAGDDQSRFSSPPPVSAAPRHFLPHELDPRSPSDGIDRTPIPVSAPPDTVADPRSPSAGIVRTPIVSLPAESGQCYHRHNYIEARGGSCLLLIS